MPTSYETDGVAIKEFVGLKPKIYSLLVDDSIEHKRGNCVNRKVAATISHGEFKDVLLNKKCLRHSMNRIQSKDHRIRTYEINKIHLFCSDDKTCIYTLIWIQCLSSWLLELIMRKAFLSSQKNLF